MKIQLKKIIFICFLLAGSLAFADETIVEKSAETSENTKASWGFRFKDVNPNPYELGFYFKDYFPVARMSSHSTNFAGGGISFAYHSPITFVLPEFMPEFFGEYWNVGFSGRLDFVGANKNDDYVQSWWTTNLLGGAFLEIVFSDWFEVQPTVEYGLQFDIVKSTRKANGTYTSQALLLSPTFKFKPIYTLKDNLSFEVTPFWNISFETDGPANYLGLRLGIMYRLGKKPSFEKSSDSKIQYVEKIVIKEVEKPVYIEVIKEVPAGTKTESHETVEEITIETNADGTLNIQLPVFSFVPDKAVLTDDKHNEEIITELVAILKNDKYASYKCKVIGYINPDNEIWSAAEYDLASHRAETIVKRLVSEGVNKKRLSFTHGEGKTENKVYNRRVEVKLYK